MIAHQEIAQQPDAIGRWSEALNDLHGRIAHRFARLEVRDRASWRYLLGLLGRVERKRTVGSLLKLSARTIHLASKGCSTRQSGTPTLCATICTST
jgi:hypothetical protein